MIQSDFKLYNGLARRNDLSSEAFRKLIDSCKALGISGFPNDGWDVHWARRWEFPMVTRALLQQLSEREVKAGKIMESGSGITQVPFWLANFGFQVTGIDFDASLEGAWSKVTPSSGSATFKHGDMLNLPVRDESYDASYSISAIEHTNNPLRAIEELVRVTKRGGCIAFTMDVDIANTDSVPVSIFNTVQELLNDTTEPSYPIRVWSPAEVLTFNSRTIRPQNGYLLGLKSFMHQSGLYRLKDQCIFFYCGRRK